MALHSLKRSIGVLPLALAAMCVAVVPALTQSPAQPIGAVKIKPPYPPLAEPFVAGAAQVLEPGQA